MKTNPTKYFIQINLGIIVLCLSTLISGCSSSFPDDNTPKGTISGIVRVFDDIDTIQGVSVRADDMTGVSAKNGRFAIDDFPESERTVVLFEKDGYIPAIRIIDVQDKKATDLQINLMEQKQFFEKLDSEADETVTDGDDDNGYGYITIPANSLAYLDDETNEYKPFTGRYDCSFTVINPADENGKEIFPGDFTGVPCDDPTCRDSTGEPAPLISYGYFNLVLKDTQNGRKLQLAEGEPAIISIPIPKNLIPVPPEKNKMGFWNFNEVDGIWYQRDTLTLSESGEAYVGEVRHFSFFGAAESYTPVLVKGTILDCDIEDPLTPMDPFKDVEVVITGEDPFNTWKSVQKLTNSDGSFSIPCYPDSNAKIHILQNGEEFTLSDVNTDFKILSEGNQDLGALPACSEYKQVEMTVRWNQHPRDLDIEMIFVPEKDPSQTEEEQTSTVLNQDELQLLRMCKQQLSAGGAKVLDDECIDILEKKSILQRLWYKKPALDNAILVSDGNNEGSRGNSETIQILEKLNGSYTFKVKHYAGINTMSSPSSDVKATLTTEDYTAAQQTLTENIRPGQGASGVNDVWMTWELSVEGGKVTGISEINVILNN